MFLPLARCSVEILSLILLQFDPDTDTFIYLPSMGDEACIFLFFLNEGFTTLYTACKIEVDVVLFQ